MRQQIHATQGAKQANARPGVEAETCVEGKWWWAAADTVTIGNASWTTRLFDTAEIDCDDSFTIGAFGIEVPIAGDYLVGAQVAWNPDVTGVRGARVTRWDGGSTSRIILHDARSAPSSTAIDHAWSLGSTLIAMDANDRLYLEVYQSSGGNLSLLTGQRTGYLSGYPDLTCLWAIRKCACGATFEPVPSGS